MAVVKHFSDLWVYQQAFQLAMRLFELSRCWPAEERYALTDQIRRSSRSVCANVAEAWRKRRYPNHFISKLSDADGEVAETQNWLAFAEACGYLTAEQREELWAVYGQISAGLVSMMAHAEAWCGPSHCVRESAAEYCTNAENEQQ